MEDITGLLGGIALAVAIAAVIMVFQRRKRAQSWEGVVTDIRRVEVSSGHDDEPPEPQIQVHYRMSNGRKGTLKFNEYEFGMVLGDVKAGDRLIKEAGADYPRAEAAGRG